MKRVLVTGASGFIGASLVGALREHGFVVRRLGRGLAQSADGFSADMRVPESLAGCCTGIDTVCHLAAVAHTRAPAAVHEEVTIRGTQALLAEASRAGVKQFIYFSSVKVEHSNDDYSRSRRVAEELVVNHSPAMLTAIVRPSLVYGPGVRGNMGRLLDLVDRGIWLPVPDLPSVRGLVHRDDVVAAVLAIIMIQPRQGLYTLSDGHPYRLREIYLEMCKATGRLPNRYRLPSWQVLALAKLGDGIRSVSGLRVPFDSAALAVVLESCYSTDPRAWSALGVFPQFSLASGLPAMVAYLREQKSKGRYFG